MLLDQLDASKLKMKDLKKRLKQAEKIKEQNTELLENVSTLKLDWNWKIEQLKEELEEVKKQQQHHKKLNEKLQSQSKELNSGRL